MKDLAMRFTLSFLPVAALLVHVVEGTSRKPEGRSTVGPKMGWRHGNGPCMCTGTLAPTSTPGVFLFSGPHPLGPHPLGPHPSGPHPSGPHPSGPQPSGPHPSGPHPSGPHPSGPHPSRLHPSGPHPSRPHPSEPQYSSEHESKKEVFIIVGILIAEVVVVVVIILKCKRDLYKQISPSPSIGYMKQLKDNDQLQSRC